MEGERRMFRVRVADLLDEFSGSSAYMDLDALNRVLREGATISGAFISADPARSAAIICRAENTPRVASISSKRAALASFRQTVAENFLRMRIFNVIFGCTIAAGVVYNSARIALSERSRELATLRVVGFTRGEISSIFLGEVGLLVVAAIPFGLLIGYGFAAFATTGIADRDAAISSRRAVKHLRICRHSRAARGHRLQRDRAPPARPARSGERSEITGLMRVTKQRLSSHRLRGSARRRDRVRLSTEARSGRVCLG